jgi:iron complex outermembrane receptor protein
MQRLTAWSVLAALLFFGLLSWDTRAAAQQGTGTLRGQVVGEAGAPVAGTQVTVVSETTGAERTAAVGEAGTFTVALPTGTYEVRVRALGHRGAEQRVRLDAGGEAVVRFRLQPAAIALEEVVVGITRTSVPVEAIPGAVTVVTREQIDAQAELTPRMGDILTQLVPGLSAGTQSMSNYGQSFRGRSVVVLIDGVPQSTSRNGMRDFLTIDPEMVERVEVLRGATSLYGEGATGGVINVITRRGADGPLRFTTEVSTHSSLSASGDGLGGRVAQTVSGGRGILDFVAGGAFGRTGSFYDAQGDRIPSNPHGQGGVADLNSWDLLGKVGASFGEQRVQVTANYFRAEQDTEFTGDPAVNAADSDATKARAIPGLDLDRNLGSENLLLNLDYARPELFGSRVHAQAYYRDYLTRFSPYDGRPYASFGNNIIQSHIDSEKLGGRLELETWLPVRSSPSLLWGLDYVDETTSQPVSIMDPAAFDGSGGLVFRTVGQRPWVPPVDTRSLGLFAQLAWNPFERLMLRGGVRHERARVSVDDFTTIQGSSVEGGELDYSPVLFNAGAVLDVARGASVYASFSQGFSLADVGRLLRGVPAGFALGSNGFEAQTVDQYEVGARVLSRRVQASLSGFRNESDLGSTFNQELEIVRAPERVYGIEATLDVVPMDPLKLGGTFTWTEGENLPGGSGEWIPLDGYRIQPRKVTAYAEHRTLPGWTNRLQLLHSGSRDRLFGVNPQAYGAAPVDAYTVVDLLSTLAVGPGTLSVGVENLLNEQYFPVVSQLEAAYGNFYRAAARGATLSLGYSVRY